MCGFFRGAAIGALALLFLLLSSVIGDNVSRAQSRSERIAADEMPAAQVGTVQTSSPPAAQEVTTANTSAGDKAPDKMPKTTPGAMPAEPSAQNPEPSPKPATDEKTAYIPEEIPKPPAAPPPKSPDTLPATQKRVALTFDDGPSAALTPRLLELLRRYDAKCTFFVLGCMAEKHPELLSDILADGHSIGNHTYHHINPYTNTEQSLLDDISATNALIYESCGVSPRLFRPPYGNLSRDTKWLAEMRVVFWTVDSRDWKHRDAKKTVSHTLPDVKDGSIILMHDIYEETLEAAELLLEALRAEGYVFVTAETLLGMDAE